MKRFSLATLIAMFATVAYSQNGPQWTLEELNRTIDQTNFVVGSGCSGTLISIDYRLVLTAHHCVENSIRVVTRDKRQPDGTVKKVRRELRERIKIEQRDYRGHEQVGAISYQTDIVAAYKDRDLALLQLVGDNLRSVRHARVLPEAKAIIRGDRVIAVGNPRGLDSSLTSGVVSSANRAIRVPWAGDEDVPMIQFDAAAAPGSSGGALYDSAGYLIGVVVAGRSGEFALAIPVADVRDMLREHCFAEAFDLEADDEACREKAEGDESGTSGSDEVDAEPQRHSALDGCAATLIGGGGDETAPQRLDGFKAGLKNLRPTTCRDGVGRP